MYYIFTQEPEAHITPETIIDSKKKPVSMKFEVICSAYA